ncbi:Rpn family recombination-promoting nuclease/putative transposase [Clostridium sp. OS1-26]|uniref:Rpn family recombination-promoting nuclease/putative transposase n=1 Tax=Clostridium sp. OS1-26 TaxID=3070681 RepID=UPI0027E08558|nr:Rpn family recombination-promoting nuclease/putative transposase [Clostridium sp. OS1-26]WML33571.1 Rpn family recombination-promoting nuclease/putative transposase [Clostridium sp. OS1-26]
MLRYNYNLALNIDFIKEEDEKAYHEHDVGYKYIFSHKPTFIELLRSFVKTDWANSINEKDLVLLDKSYILSDFKEEESDIVYRVNIEDEEVIFYVLLEFQSKVDFQMPIRLLFYMTEIWRDVLKNVGSKERRRKNFKLPAVVPIVLYNGLNRWTAEKSFRRVLNGENFVKDNIVDFNYILLDVNRYKEEELLEVANLVSAVFLIDSNIDEKQLIKRLKKVYLY